MNHSVPPDTFGHIGQKTNPITVAGAFFLPEWAPAGSNDELRRGREKSLLYITTCVMAFFKQEIMGAVHKAKFQK